MVWYFMKALIELILALFSPKKKAEIKEQKIDKELLDARVSDEASNDPIAYKKSRKRLQDEHAELRTHNMDLYNILGELDVYAHEKYKKNIIITMIYRTAAEQDHLYRNSAKYAKKKFKSPHQFWHGVDIRSRTFTEAEIKHLVTWMNKKFKKGNYYKWVAKCHDIGSGMHFHIQYAKS